MEVVFIWPISMRKTRSMAWLVIGIIIWGYMGLYYVVAGLEHGFMTFHFIYGMSSFPLMNSIIFQDG